VDIPGLLGQENQDLGASEVGGGEGRIPGYFAREDSEPSALGVEGTGGGILGGMGGWNIEPGAQEVRESMTGGIPGLLDREDSEREALGVESLEIGVSEVQVSGVEDVREITSEGQGGLDNIIGVSAGEANCWDFEMLGIGSNEELIRKDTGFSFLDLISAKSIDSKQRSGWPQALSESEKDSLVEFIKQDFTRRQMSLVDIRRESGLSHVSDTTFWKALKQRGIKAYREKFKFILKSENKLRRLCQCLERRSWKQTAWSNYGFTDEMSFDMGALVGLQLVWREMTERWHEDCGGAMKKQGATVMCWGMIGRGWKGPFHVWVTETDKEREEAATGIAIMEATRVIEEDELNSIWKVSDEWRQQKLIEQVAYRLQRHAEKSANVPKKRIPQTWGGKKYKIEQYKRGDGKGVDSWGYVKAVARPLL